MKTVRNTVIGAFSIVIIISLLSSAISFFGYNNVIGSVNNVQVNKLNQDKLQELSELSVKRQQLITGNVVSMTEGKNQDIQSISKKINEIANSLLGSGISKEDGALVEDLISLNNKYNELYSNTMAVDIKAFDNKSITEFSKTANGLYNAVQKTQIAQKDERSKLLEAGINSGLNDLIEINRKLKTVNADAQEVDDEFLLMQNLLTEILNQLDTTATVSEISKAESDKKLQQLEQYLSELSRTIGLIVSNSQTNRFDRVSNMKKIVNDLKIYETLEQLIYLTASSNSKLMYSAAASEDVNTHFKADMDEIDKLLVQLNSLNYDKATLDKITNQHNSYRSAALEVLKRSTLMSKATVTNGYKSLTEMNVKFADDIYKLRLSFNTYLANDIKTSEKIKITILWALALITLLSIFVGMVIAFVVARKITNPINALVSTLSRVEKGDLTVRADVKTDGEIGGLGRKVNSVLDGQQKMVEQFKDTTNEISNLKQRLTVLVKQNRESVNKISTGKKDSVKTGGIALNTESIITDVKSVSIQTQKAVDDSKRAIEIAKSREKTVEEAEMVINTVNETVKSIAASISKLEASSGKIGEITNTITQIASQTNLLALNAAIEANRAGQQGKGFAVVADEIRKLSNASNQSAGEIKNQIKEIQSSIDFAVEKMNIGVEGVEDGAHRINEVKAGIAEIIESVNQVAQAIKDSAEKAHTHYESTIQFVEAVDTMSRTANETAVTGDINSLIEIQINTLKDLDQITLLLNEASVDLKNISNKVKS